MKASVKASVLSPLVLAFASSAPVLADTLTLTPTQDNSMFQELTGQSNGAGSFLFAGASGQGARRALMSFDVAGSIPAGATIDSVSLRLRVNRAGPFAANNDVYRLHRVHEAWGEGTSDASGIGTGAPATPGDATWIFRIFNTDAWSTPGGEFAATQSRMVTMPTSGSTTVTSSVGLVSDVQSWLDDAANNFGWILIGNEAQSRVSRRFVSRQGSANQVPRLTVNFTPAPASVPTVSEWSMILMGIAVVAGLVFITLRQTPATARI